MDDIDSFNFQSTQSPLDNRERKRNKKRNQTLGLLSSFMDLGIVIWPHLLLTNVPPCP